MDGLQPTEIVDQPVALLSGEFSQATGSNAGGSNETTPDTIPNVRVPQLNIAASVVSDSIDTQARAIKGTYTFDQMGAIQIGDYVSGVSGQILISPAGLVATNSSGVNTVTIDGTTGNATFIGTITASNFIGGTIAIGSGNTIFKVDSAGNMWSGHANQASAPFQVSNTGNLIASNATISGTITGSTITGSVISGGSITGVTVTGSTISGGNININNAFIVNSVGDVQCQTIQFTNLIYASNAINIGANGEITGPNNGFLDVNTGHGNIETRHLDPTVGDLYNLGGSSRWWFAINYHFLTKQGGFGVFDDGVEMQDGKILTDTEALLAMKPDKVKKEWGKPIFDFNTLPKVIRVYPKTNDGKLVRKNKQGKYIDKFGDEHQEGEDVNAMISIMIGALRELTTRVKTLESQNN